MVVGLVDYHGQILVLTLNPPRFNPLLLETLKQISNVYPSLSYFFPSLSTFLPFFLALFLYIMYFSYILLTFVSFYLVKHFVTLLCYINKVYIYIYSYHLSIEVNGPI